LGDFPFNYSGFQAHLNQGKLAGALCSHCAALHVPPRSLCPCCFHDLMRWQELSGAGTLLAFTVIHVGLPEMAAVGCRPDTPYCSGIVQLKEGPAVSALIVGVDAARPQSIQAGLPLQAVFIPRNSGEGVCLAFAPAAQPIYS